jgi:hypothetical protein
MTSSDEFEQILNRIEEKKQTDADIFTLRQMLCEYKNDSLSLIQLGKYNINIGDAREIHIGDRIYQQLDDEAIQAIVQAIQKNTPKKVFSQFQSLIEDKTTDFVGREYVFQEIEQFIDNNSKGYFTITGDPGQGKSAILAKYVQNTGCIAHFNISLQGLNRADQFLESVCSQLIEGYQLNYNPLPSNTTEDGEFLSQLLDEAAKKRNGEAIIIAVDALDEVDENSYRDAANILYLPAHLPDGVYFILTRRRDVEVPLTSFAPMKILNLLDYQSESEQDEKTYIGNRVDSSENLRLQINIRGETITEFTEKITEKSENNFMYLRYVLIDIESGLYQDLNLEQFPQGLQGYYEFHWRRMNMDKKPLPMVKIEIIYFLGEAYEPISFSKICNWSKESEYIVEMVLVDWSQFLHKLLKNEEILYSIYHSSFRDFLQRKAKEKYPGIIKKINLDIARHELKAWEKFKEILKNRRGQ